VCYPCKFLASFFHSTVVRKKLLIAEEAERAVMAFRSAMTCGSIEPQDVSDVIEVHRRYQIRYWDSLIIAIAARHGCTEIRSEDLNDGQIFMGAVVSNPFRVEFWEIS
jgi:predicted nucleic acid-binding protein